MGRTESEETKCTEYGAAAQAMHRRLHSWRRAHPEATFDEIAEQVSQERKVQIGNLLAELASEAKSVPLDPVCPTCGGAVEHKGKKKRQVLHREGEVQLVRDYYYCPACRQGFFPSRPEFGIE